MDERESRLTGDVNDVWDVFLTIYRGKIGDCTPGDAIGIPRNAYDADVRGRGEVLDCMRPVSISTRVYEGHTVQRAADGAPACITEIDDYALFQRGIYLLGIEDSRLLVWIGQG